MRGTGVVEVKVTEGPMDFAHHAVGFAAYGTVVRLVADAHRPLEPGWSSPSTTRSSPSTPPPCGAGEPAGAAVA